MTLQVLTAYDLRSGLVVYLDRAGNWSRFIADARVARTEAESEACQALGEAAQAANLVFETYLVDVTEEKAGPRPVRYREVIRAFGPTVHPQFGTQAERGGGER